MEMKSLLLDTNAIIKFFGGDTSIVDYLSRWDRLLLSAVVVGELEAGFRNGNRYAKNADELDAFVRLPMVEFLPVTRETAAIYGETFYRLKSAGTPIPINDVWIAAQAFEHGSVLATFDRHFDHVPGLRLWDPPESISG